MKSRIGFNPTQEQIQEQIRQLPEIKPEKAVVLEFEDVAPRWNKAIQKMHEASRKLNKGSVSNLMRYSYESEFGISLTNHKSCLVGEAHGFNDGYNKNCDKCRKFAGIPAIRSVIQVNEKEFKQFKTDFMKHYNEAHL